MAHRYGGCDSYFEEMDEGIHIMRAEARERQRAVNRIHQKALAEQLSRVTADEYEEDILDHMERMEVRLQTYCPKRLHGLTCYRPRQCQT